MKTNYIFLFLILSVFSCKKPTTEIEPPIEVIEKPINYIKYLGSDTITEVKLPLTTTILFKCAYNITVDELAPNGFAIWQFVSRKKDLNNPVVTNKISLTNRTDTVKYSVELWSSFFWGKGDTLSLTSNLIRINEDKSGYILAKTKTLTVIINK